MYNEGQVVKLNDKKVEVKYTKGKGPTEVGIETIFQKNDYEQHPDGYEDMVDMENLSDAELLYNTKLRFEKNLIFTYVGQTLLVLNPYFYIPELYAPEVLEKYQLCALKGNFDLKEYPPHVWAISADTMIQLFEN